ncbi:hypothetical protein B0H15DRAFT_958619 [Mycena belliarum]|uniref:SWIM-type domain-containing protein n=1 Tax=Mycena belliarum TaxID=1033014 RepID=A0AAD6TQJ5_9AGAR|nr:hypothetical protein B0H15DRAFT_958619 [Mycena belliae]
MAVDEDRKGVPIAFLLFSAPAGNKQSSSGYDTTILTKLIRKWSESLNRCAHLYGRAGIIFRPISAITDTDLKERAALIIIFPDIWLLICRFHLRQSWRNNRNKRLKGKSAVTMDLKRRMVALERSLTATQTISEAHELLAAERKVMETLQASHPRAARKAIQHIDYLDKYWTTENLWKSWSDYGRTVVASLLGCTVDGVIPTTNHLESFNGVLKRVHLRRWQNGGRRICMDVLIHALVIYILPSIFEQRRLDSEQRSRIAALIRLLPGGASLLEQKKCAKPSAPAVPKVAYLLRDVERDARAQELVANRQISAPALLPGDIGLTLTSYSANALAIDSSPTTYTIRMGFNGVVSCTCRDFQDRGGACKHIRGALIVLDHLRMRGTNIPQIPIPQSLADAQELQSKTFLTITIRPQLPTTRAAEKVEDILSHVNSEQDVEQGDDDEDDSASVATDASSDSDDDGDDRDTVVATQTAQNIAALGEQAVSRTMFELRELGPKFTELGSYLDYRTTALTSDERDEMGKSLGQLINLQAKLERVLQLPPNLPPNAVALTPSAPTPLSPSPPERVGKRKLLPASPERQQKRHQSFGIH